MATVKSHSDLQQSKKLAKILPLESADMVYVHTIDLEGDEHYNIDFRNNQPLFEDDISAWSLAALLNVLPDELEDNHFLTLQKEKNEYCCCYEGLNNSFRHNTFADNPVDACYEMILKLNELNLLRLWKQKK